MVTGIQLNTISMKKEKKTDLQVKLTVIVFATILCRHAEHQRTHTHTHRFVVDYLLITVPRLV